VRLLAGDDDSLLTTVDRVLDIALTATKITSQIDLFGPKNAVIGLLRELRTRAGERAAVGARKDRADLMVAAHTVLVTSAFFDELGTYEELATVRWRGEDQRILIGSLVDVEPPVPSALVPPERLAVDLADYYATLARRTEQFLAGLVVWDDLTESARIRVSARLSDQTPAAAIRRYKQNVRELAGQVPGFAFWLGVWDHAATRAQVGEVRKGLAEVAQRLAAQAPSGDVAQRWRQLARRYAADLDAPVIASGEHGAPPDLVIPSLGAAYLDPAFRVTVAEPVNRLAEDHWWDEATEAREDLASFLVRHLSSPEATVRPLLVLGHPGAGKSVFTRAFAARLQNTGFRPLRIDLRRVPADAPIVDQVRAALREALQCDVDWADLADDSGDGTPVIFFDGFDELLQGATAGRSDYLERLCEFQDIARVTRDCPVAVVVTSRTVVADRARIPSGTTAVRLESFDEGRVSRWLATWNGANAEYYARHGLTPLGAETLARHQHLAGQPLLLLLLALYDATDNALRREVEALADADLYDRLLRSFVHREMLKGREHEDDAVVAALVEQELERLAVAALAMFNRRSRQVADHDLDADMTALIGANDDSARRLVGRFFFVHVAEARYERVVHTYEFLHATFGEYLVAWFVFRALPEPAPRRALASVRSEVDDALLAAVLSYDLLAFSTPALEFLEHMLGGLPDRPSTHELLLEAFRQRFQHLPWRGYEPYRPTGIDFMERAAAYSTNLMLLVLMTADGWCPLADLFGPGTPDELNVLWRREVRLWLSRHGRSSVDVLAGLVEYHRGNRPAVRMMSTTPVPVDDSLGISVGRLQRRNMLAPEPELTDLLRAVTPVVEIFRTELQPSSTSRIAPAHALLNVLSQQTPSATDYIKAAKAAAGLPPARQEVYDHLLLHHLSAASPAVGSVVLETLLQLNPRVSIAYLRCLASLPLSPVDRTRLASAAECGLGLLNQVLKDAEADPRLVPIAVDLWQVNIFDRNEPLRVRLSALLRELPDSMLRSIPAERLRELGWTVPAAVLARRDSLADEPTEPDSQAESRQQAAGSGR